MKNKRREEFRQALKLQALKDLALALMRFFPECFGWDDVNKILSKAAGLTPNWDLEYNREEYNMEEND